MSKQYRCCRQAHGQGRRLATVALYQVSFDEADEEAGSPYWHDFDPRPVECVTGDVTEQQRRVESIPEAEWSESDAMLARIPQPYEPGLHRLWTD